jgi:hypothetical protein
VSRCLSYHSNLNLVISVLQAIGGRPRRFGVQCRVLLPVEGARERGEEEKAMWCLIFEDQAPGFTAQEKGEEKEYENERKRERQRERERGGVEDSALPSCVQTSSHILARMLLITAINTDIHPYH